MNQLQTMWSISRRKSLINCPREYVLRYSSNQTQYDKQNIKSNKKSLEDILVTCLREVMIERLEDQKNGIIWSSCSPDFGVQGVVDRFKQIEPSILITSDL